MPSRKRKIVKPKSQEAKKVEEIQPEAEKVESSKDPVAEEVKKEEPKAAANPVRISIAGLKLQPISMSGIKILPRGSLNVLAAKSPAVPAAVPPPAVPASPKTPIVLSTTKVIPLSASGLNISQLKVASVTSLKPPAAPLKVIAKPVHESYQVVKIERSASNKKDKDPLAVSKKPSKIQLEVPKPEPTPKKVIKLEAPVKQVIKVAESPESRRSGLRGIKLDINFLLGRKESPRKESPQKKPKVVAKKALKAEPPEATSAIQYEVFNAYTDSQFPCKKCPLIFLNRKEFMDHRKLHKKSNFDCGKCSQTFRFQSSFLNHSCDFWCQVCGKTISNKANLKIHMSYVHGIGEAKYFNCDMCGRTYKSKRNIDTHMKNHMQSTPFHCAICGKGFSHLGALKIHMWNHRDAVDCDYCGKKFKPRSLYYHVKKCPYALAILGQGHEIPQNQRYSMKEEHLEEEILEGSEFALSNYEIEIVREEEDQ